MGELIAEIGGCFMASELGLPTADSLNNHASYVQTWLKAIKGDASFIIKTASQASKAVDYLLSFSRQPIAEPLLVG